MWLERIARDMASPRLKVVDALRFAGRTASGTSWAGLPLKLDKKARGHYLSDTEGATFILPDIIRNGHSDAGSPLFDTAGP
jgi:hypothetical protein